jgi:hypothetical protein
VSRLGIRPQTLDCYRGSIPRKGRSFFLFATAATPVLGPLSLLYSEYRELFPPGGKRPGSEADPPSSHEVENEWKYASIPLYVIVEFH